jgi:hypothetical protein
VVVEPNLSRAVKRVKIPKTDEDATRIKTPKPLTEAMANLNVKDDTDGANSAAQQDGGTERDDGAAIDLRAD